MTYGDPIGSVALRSAGAPGTFATIVRRLSPKVRGDDSYSDVLRLNEMQSISITNEELDYGIAVDGLFWVQQGILSREYIRQSRDEELIADPASPSTASRSLVLSTKPRHSEKRWTHLIN